MNGRMKYNICIHKIHTYICACVCLHTYLLKFIHTYIHPYVHKHMLIDTHLHTHIHEQEVTYGCVIIDKGVF